MTFTLQFRVPQGTNRKGLVDTVMKAYQGSANVIIPYIPDSDINPGQEEVILFAYDGPNWESDLPQFYEPLVREAPAITFSGLDYGTLDPEDEKVKSLEKYLGSLELLL